jgi:serine/threonine-protein kinase RsbW
MLSVVRGFIETACQQYGLPRPILHALVLASGEAFTNVVRHAHRDQPQFQVEIDCEIRPDAVVLDIQDEGEPFDLTAIPHLAPGELRIGGRGVYLLRTLMDEVTCQPRGEGKSGNRLRMVKRFEPAPVIRHCG